MYHFSEQTESFCSLQIQAFDCYIVLKVIHLDAEQLGKKWNETKQVVFSELILLIHSITSFLYHATLIAAL